MWVCRFALPEHFKQAALAEHAARSMPGESGKSQMVRGELAASASSIGGHRARRQCVGLYLSAAAVDGCGMWEQQMRGRRLCTRTAGHPARPAFAPRPEARLDAAIWARATRGLGAAASPTAMPRDKPPPHTPTPLSLHI